MELILVVVISAGMAGNSQNGVSRSLKLLFIQLRLVARGKLLSHILYVLLVFFVLLN